MSSRVEFREATSSQNRDHQEDLEAAESVRLSENQDTTKVRIESLVSKMRSKEDMYELISKHSKYLSIINVNFSAILPT